MARGSPKSLYAPWWETQIWHTESFVCTRRFLHTPAYFAGMDKLALAYVASPLLLTYFAFFDRSVDGDEMTEHTQVIERHLWGVMIYTTMYSILRPVQGNLISIVRYPRLYSKHANYGILEPLYD